MNKLNNNLRKPIDRRHRPEWRYKASALVAVSRMLNEALNEEWLTFATIG